MSLEIDVPGSFPVLCLLVWSSVVVSSYCFCFPPSLLLLVRAVELSFACLKNYHVRSFFDLTRPVSKVSQHKLLQAAAHLIRSPQPSSLPTDPFLGGLGSSVTVI